VTNPQNEEKLQRKTKFKWTARLNTRVFALSTYHIKITKEF